MKDLKSEPPKDSDMYRRYVLNYAKAVMGIVSEEDLEFAKRTDTDEIGPFIEYLVEHRIVEHPEDILRALDRSEFIPFMDYIMRLKDYYGVSRPFELARQFGEKLPFEHGSQTATCASYPSGHAAAAFFIANLLTRQFLQDHPYRDQHRCELFNIANRIAWGRVCLGVHSVQDIREGARLANVLFA